MTDATEPHQFGNHRHRTRTDAYTTEKLCLLGTSPGTDSERASYTTSISWGASLSLGFFGGTPTAGLSGSWSWSSSYTVDLKDTAIINNSPNNTVGWRFDILPGSKISTNTFQPIVQALWSSPASTRKKNRDLYEQDYMSFDITFAPTTYQWDGDTVKKYKDDKYEAQKLVDEETSLPIG